MEIVDLMGIIAIEIVAIEIIAIEIIDWDWVVIDWVTIDRVDLIDLMEIVDKDRVYLREINFK